MNITADQQRCIGAGMCALTAPAVFDQNDHDGRVLVLDPHPHGHTADTAADAIRLCPSGAITTTEQH